MVGSQLAGVMASTAGKEPTSSPTAANAPAVAMDAKLMVATGRDDVQQLKDLLNKEDATTMVVVMAPSNINPLLLASACFGSWKALNFLFDREDAQAPPMMMPTKAFLDLLKVDTSDNGTMKVQQTSDDVEEGGDLPASPAGAAPLLEGVTAEGDTALHAVASHGDGPGYLECATIIYGRAKHLLFALNNKGDTPLHCAARAGKSEMVSRLIDLARGEDEEHNFDRQHQLLRKENEREETALHDAVRTGNKDIVELLMTADSELASYPKEGTSPLYLAIHLEKESIAKTLYDKSKGNLSYSGPDGQNALHAAVLCGIAMTKKLLEWNKSLTTQGDRNGSTPLHFASSSLRRRRRYPDILKEVFEANRAAVYQADNSGLFPIHVAASMGLQSTIRMFLEKCRSTAGLCTARGETFLHVAVEKRRSKIVSFVCWTPSLAWILNMQNKDGNTALHIAVRDGMIIMFASLFGNRKVELNLTNNNGETPLDLARSNLPLGMNYKQNNESQIYMALEIASAKYSGHRWDHIQEKYSRHLKQPDYQKKESEKLKDSTQTLCVGSALIATVTFGATFAQLPGGYRADDRPFGGTPTLAGRYAFDAFIMANTFAFICSAIATVGFMFSGTTMVNLFKRQEYLRISVYFMFTSITSLTAAFALGAYLVLAPVAPKTAIAICVISCPVALSTKRNIWRNKAVLALPLYMRMGPIWTSRHFVQVVVCNMLLEYWPLVFTFLWAAAIHGRNNHVTKMELPEQPPTPLA